MHALGLATRKKKNVRNAVFAVVFLLVLSLLGAPTVRAASGETLHDIRSRGALRCGVSRGIIGFSAQDKAGKWSGMDVDFCRAVAAVVLGSPDKVRFVPLRASERFQALTLQSIDILTRNTTWSVEREASFSTIFVGVLYYDAQGFMAPAASRFAHAETLSGARICVERGSNQSTNLARYARRHGWQVSTLVARDVASGYENFLQGKCDVLTDDLAAMHDFLLRVPDPTAYVIRPERIAREPLGPVVRWNDGQWLAIVRAVYAALLDAASRGLTEADARAMLKGESIAARTEYLDETALIGRAFGLAPDWALAAVAAVGNYDEMFRRNLGSESQIKLDRGANRPWSAGGLLYAPPFQ